MSCAPSSAPRRTSPKIGDRNWLATLRAQAPAADRQPESAAASALADASHVRWPDPGTAQTRAICIPAIVCCHLTAAARDEARRAGWYRSGPDRQAGPAPTATATRTHPRAAARDAPHCRQPAEVSTRPAPRATAASCASLRPPAVITPGHETCAQHRVRQSHSVDSVFSWVCGWAERGERRTPGYSPGWVRVGCIWSSLWSLVRAGG